MQHEDVRNELILDARRLREELGDADAIVITGDTAFSGKQNEYAKTGEWLSQLCKVVGCPEESVLVVPGNHDVDWSQITGIVEDQHGMVADIGLDKLDNHIASRFHRDELACNMLLAKLNNYIEFASRYGRDFQSCRTPFWLQNVFVLESPIIRFMGLNTVLFSDKRDAKGRLVVGPNQYIWPRDDDVVCIALLHHPLEWLKDGQQAQSYFESRARLWLTGHEHKLAVRKSENEQGFEWLEIRAGATCPPSEDGYEFRYGWLRLSVQTTDASRQLVVSFWPRVWSAASTQFSADRNRLSGQKNKDFYLTLPEVKLKTTATMPETQKTEPGPSMPSLPDNDAGEGPIMPESGPLISRDDQSFRRLRFIFWKKLDRQQRVRVLVELGMVPDEFQLTPVWLHRGVEAARHQGKLRDMWDSVMAHLPSDQQEPNPFSS